MGMTGEMKVARLRDLALGKRIPMVWLLDSAGARIQEAAGSLFAGSGHLFREEVVASGVIPQVAALMGPVRGRHRLHPRAGRLRADGQGTRLDGARRAAPDQGRHRRGRDPGGARRVAHPHARVGRRRPRGRLRRGVHRRDQALPVVLRPELRAAAAEARVGRPRRPQRGRPARRAARLAAAPVRHVRGDPADRRRRRVVRHQAALGAHDHHRAGAHGRPAGGHRGQPAEAPRRDPRERLRRQGGALHQPVRRLRHPAAVPDGRARVHGRHQGRAGRASSATAPRCSTRSRAPRSRRSP